MAETIETYLLALPEARQVPMRRLHGVIRDSLPSGFQEVLAGAPRWVVPLTLYPAGYHCKPGTPVPYLSIASQKQGIVLYHFGLYADASLLEWFVTAWPEHSKRRLDMGKSCIRFNYPDEIPFALIGELVSLRTPEQWLAIYQRGLDSTTRRSRRR